VFAGPPHGLQHVYAPNGTGGPRLGVFHVSVRGLHVSRVCSKHPIEDTHPRPSNAGDKELADLIEQWNHKMFYSAGAALGAGSAGLLFTLGPYALSPWIMGMHVGGWKGGRVGGWEGMCTFTHAYPHSPPPLAPSLSLPGAATVWYWKAGWEDMQQKRHTIRRNFPVLGRVRCVCARARLRSPK